MPCPCSSPPTPEPFFYCSGSNLVFSNKVVLVKQEYNFIILEGNK